MPLYSLDCPACGKGFEAFLRLSEVQAGAPCPHCRIAVRDLAVLGAGPAPVGCGPSSRS
jgi:putative FmdB family regulatory protein